MHDYDIYHAAGWDFFGESVNGTDDVWRLCPDSQYPRLVWEFPQADIACPLGVDFQDYATLAMCWQEPNAVLSDVCRYSDIDESCAVNIHDLVVLTQNWLEPILPPAPIQAVLSKTNLSEADNESTIVTLSRIRETNLPLLITIVNQDPYEVHAPMYAIIPADQESTQIRVEAVNNGKVDGRQQATLVFMVEGYLDTEVVLEIEDDDREERKTLGGHLCGNLVRGDYIVTTDITVDSGQTLELLPGSILRFTSGTGLSIRGCLRAIGNSEGSIILTSESVVPQQGDWKGIIIEGKSPVIDMKHVEIANAVTGIKFILDWYAKVNLSLCNSSIHHCSNTGLYIDSRPGMNISSDDVRVFNNKIYENTDFGIVLKASSDWIVQGAFCKGPYSSTNDSYIRKNEMYQNDVGIYMTNPNIGGRCPGASGGSIGSQITGNCISYNRVAVLSDDRPHGIISATLSNNLILKNTDSGLVFHGKLSVMIANNTIVGNGGSGIRHDSYYDVVLNLVNNIITENDTGIMSLNNEESNTADIRIVGYNNVYHNTEFDWTGYPPEYGNLSTMNINGTPADIHMNVSIDPIFAGSNDFHLTSNSPMVGAGTFIEGITPEDDVDGDMRTESIDIGFDEVQ
jgi:parallel beta-helix repeat protein